MNQPLSQDALNQIFLEARTFASNPNSEEKAYIEYVKSAYHQSDLDCVRIIRTLAAGATVYDESKEP